MKHLRLKLTDGFPTIFESFTEMKADQKIPSKEKEEGRHLMTSRVVLLTR